MAPEIDLRDERDPTDRMIKQQERARERAERDDNLDALTALSDRTTGEQ